SRSASFTSSMSTATASTSCVSASLSGHRPRRRVAPPGPSPSPVQSVCGAPGTPRAGHPQPDTPARDSTGAAAQGPRKTASPGTSSGITLLSGSGLLYPHEAVPLDDVAPDVHAAAMRHLTRPELVVGGPLHVDVAEDGQAVVGQVAVSHAVGVGSGVGHRQHAVGGVDNEQNNVDQPRIAVAADRVDTIPVTVAELGERLEILLIEDQGRTGLHVFLAALAENNLVQRAVVDGRQLQVRRRVDGAGLGIRARKVGGEDAREPIRSAGTDQNLPGDALPQGEAHTVDDLGVIIEIRQLEHYLVLISA